MHDESEQDYIEAGFNESDTSGLFQIDCAFCGGTGVHLGTMGSLNHTQCPACRGKGILKLTASRNNYGPCPQCQGNGREPDAIKIEPCHNCGGYGIVKFQ